MISPFIVNDKNLFLTRFPIVQVNRSLQAWDAADEYLVNYINDNDLLQHKADSTPNTSTNKHNKIVIFNDNFGALSVNFIQEKVVCINDSFLSQQGIKYNIEQNSLDDENISYLTSLEALPSDINLILYKIPKSKALLIAQLKQIKHACHENTTFIAADRAKDIHSSTLKLFQQYLGNTTTSLAVKKARLVFCQLEAQSPVTNVESNSPHLSSLITTWSLTSPKNFADDFSITNHANVYAREKLDIGGRYFIENLPDIPANCKVIDLGCGNGVIGLTVLAKQPEAQVTFVDESFMAMASAKENLTNNLPAQVTQAEFIVNDCLTDFESNSVDLVLCNPPFHQQHATTDHIAWQMFKDSHRVLKKGGELRIIGNQKLAYHIKLKRIFGNETLVASNDKFVTQSAKKQ